MVTSRKDQNKSNVTVPFFSSFMTGSLTYNTITNKRTLFLLTRLKYNYIKVIYKHLINYILH